MTTMVSLPAPEQPHAPPGLLAGLHPAVQWAVIGAMSLLFSVVLLAIHLPAPLLIGPMAAGVIAGINGASVRPPIFVFRIAQGIVGCLVAASIRPEIFGSFAADWPIIVMAVFSTLVASSILGWLISRWGILPGTTAIWGSAPGASSAMVLMAGAFGADQRLVAFMQYLRVITVSLAAALISRLFIDTSGLGPPEIDWFPDLHVSGLLATVSAVAIGGPLLRMVGFAAPYVLGPMIAAALIQLAGGVALQLPEWLLAIAYATVGWSIGLNFTRPILRHAWKALPQVFGAIVVLILFCATMGFAVSQALGIDMLTAYLATSPGGMDSVAIIAAGSKNVDLSFILAIQLGRFIVVLLLGPPLARLLAGRSPPPDPV